MRRVRSLVALVSVLLTIPALAAKDKPVFALESDVIAARPEVAAALKAALAAPEEAAPWRALGRALAAQGAYDDAARAFRRAAKAAPKIAGVWADLGATFVRAGDPRSALQPLRRAVKLEPYLAVAHYSLGLANQALGRYDDALDEFEIAVTIDPTLGDARTNPDVVGNTLVPYAKIRARQRAASSAAPFAGPR